MHQMSKIKVDETMIHGLVSPEFKEVEAEFKRNFSERGELGAACAVYLKGKKVVDLWGGYMDVETSSPWEEDTLIHVFSATKGISALAIALAHSRGYFDYDETVSTYWPEFAENGKGNITIRELLAHQAGLCAIDKKLDIDILSDKHVTTYCIKHCEFADVIQQHRPVSNTNEEMTMKMWPDNDTWSFL